MLNDTGLYTFVGLSEYHTLVFYLYPGRQVDIFCFNYL